MSTASVEPFALLCQQLATALESARLYGESQAREREASGLYEATRRLASSLDVDELLDGVVTQVMDLLGSDASAILLWDAAQGALTFRRGVNIDADITHRLVLRPGEGVAGRAFAERRAVWSRERMADPAVSYTAAAREMIAARPARACLAVPIERRGEALGVLLGLFAAPHDFTSKEVQLLSSLSDQAAIAMGNAGLYHEARTQQTRLAQILDSTSDGIVLLGTDGRVEAANRPAGQLIGFDPDRVVGRSLVELVGGGHAPPDLAAACATLQELVAASDRSAQGDVELAGSGQVVHWTAQPTRAASGETVGLTVTFHDVTHERHVSQMKSDFVSFATHQLRTPLAGIKWMLELAAQEPGLPGEVGSHIEDAREAAQR
ncbi:MAG TPA: GAF domain-containing protein, partial [Planctomycetota bacterium]|nr:GAF domain-containing protein [Planctomycetota bacterium]